MPKGGAATRRFWVDFETDRAGITDGELPDGPLVEEISAREWYEREARSLACGWPALHHPKSEDLCPCGCLFPARTPSDWHRPMMSAEDDEALS